MSQFNADASEVFQRRSNLEGDRMSDEGKSTPLFIIVLDEILVARDIEMLIGELWPDARVLVARTLIEAEAEAPEGRLVAVFVQREAAQLPATALGQRLARDGGRLVRVGWEGDVVEDGVSILRLPFELKDVEALLAGTARRSHTTVSKIRPP
jgi:hypothetical protein